MTKVTITFEYDEENDGKLTEDDWNRIIDLLNVYGSEINTKEEKI